jgi:hypothetical protein
MIERFVAWIFALVSAMVFLAACIDGVLPGMGTTPYSMANIFDNEVYGTTVNPFTGEPNLPPPPAPPPDDPTDPWWYDYLYMAQPGANPAFPSSMMMMMLMLLMGS